MHRRALRGAGRNWGPLTGSSGSTSAIPSLRYRQGCRKATPHGAPETGAVAPVGPSGAVSERQVIRNGMELPPGSAISEHSLALIGAPEVNTYDRT